MRNVRPISSMPQVVALLVSCLSIAVLGCGSDPGADSSGGPQVLLSTTHGNLSIELFPEKAPVTVNNFLEYVESEFYDGTVFHRVIPGFMIQGGGFDAELERKPTREPIRNEADNGLKNARGTIAMARTSVVDSATSQFFINVNDNVSLDHRDESASGFGYAVFGRVVAGMEVADRIVALPTETKGPHRSVPVEPVVILKARAVR